MDEKIKRTAEALKKNRMQVILALDRNEALEKALSFIRDDSAVIGVGGSVTLNEIGLMERLGRGKFNFINQYEAGIPREENMRRRLASQHSDILFTSTNAVTETGWLVNVDGLGNRVSAIAFGPKKVVVVAGKNKICRTLEEALRRIETIAAPRNVKRLGIENPCAEGGVCVDCESETRICCATLIVKWQQDPQRLHVILVDEELGY